MTREEKAALGVVAILLGLRLWIAGTLGLVEDEAYYWVWSQRLAAGYFDHPPGIALLIRAGVEVVGHSERGVRAGGLLLGLLAALWAADTARDRGLALVALATCPLFFLGGILATPDVPLAGAWALGLWAAVRRRWALLGVACGLAMLSKYTGVLLLPLVILAEPGALRTRGPWLAALLAFLVYLPNALWNVQHDLISWQFQLHHVSEAPRRLDFLAAQLGLGGPLLALVVAAWWAVGWRGERTERLLWWTSLPVLLVGVWAGGEANWAAMAWIGGILGVATRAGGRWARAAWVGAGLNLALGGLVLLHTQHPLVRLPDDPIVRLAGGRVLGDTVRAWGLEAVYTERYQEAALIHFYAGIPAHALPQTARADQYDLWPVTLAEHALFVRPHRGARTLPPIEAAGYRWDELTTVRVPESPLAWDVAEVWRSEAPE